jgi:isoleucyl-tRNA synthetase
LDAAAVAKSVARGERISVVASSQTLELSPADLLVESTAATGFACAEGDGYLVGLDTTLTDELLREGLARELVRTIQEARKQAGLHVSDRIVLEVEGNLAMMAALAAHRDYVGTETLASRWERPGPGAFVSIRHDLGSASWVIRLERDEAPALVS